LVTLYPRWSVSTCNGQSDVTLVTLYQYACGGWVKANTIPQGESRWDTFGMLRRKNQLAIKNLLGKPQRHFLQI